MREKIIHHIQNAVLASIITFSCILIVRGLEIPNYIHKSFFNKNEIVDATIQKLRQNDQENLEDKIPTKLNYKEHITKAKKLESNLLDDLAISEYNEAIRIDSKNPEPYILIAFIHEKNQNIEKALESIQTAYEIEKTPDTTNAYLRILIKSNKIDEAKTIIDSLTTLNSEETFYKAIVLALKENYDESQKTFETAKNSNTDTETASNINTYIKAYEDFNLTEGAQKTYIQALIGQSLIKTGFYSTAIDLLYKVIKEKHDYRDAWIMLGYSYIKIKSYNDAIEAMQTALDLDPVKPETRYFLGLAYFGVKNYSDAISNIEIAITNGFEPKTEGMQQLAEIAILNNEYEKAAKTYSEIVKSQKTDIQTYIRPVWLYIDKLNKAKDAIKIAEQAVQKFPDTALAYNLLGWAQTANNDYKNGYKNLQKAIDLDPSLTAAYLNLGWWYEKQNQIEKAKSYYRSSYDIDPNSPEGNLAGERFNKLVTTEEVRKT